MMIHLQSCGFLVILLCFVSEVPAQQNGGDYHCSPWKDGEEVTITFRIDRSKFPSECLQGVNGKPFFMMSTDGGNSYFNNCTLAADIRSTGSCNFQPTTLGCGCTAENDGGYYVIMHKFIAGSDYGKFWQASINCFDNTVTVSMLNFNQTDCQPIPDATTTPATTETSEQTSTSSVLPPDDGLDAGQIAGIVVGCVVILVIIIIIIVFILKKKKGCVGMPFSAPTDSPQPVNGHNVSAAPTSTADKPPTNTGNGSDRRQ